MKTVLKGHARPRWKKEVKMKLFKPGVKLVMFHFYFVAFLCCACRVVSCRVVFVNSWVKVFIIA